MDVAENPNDTEEAVWHLLAMARTEGLGKATRSKNGRDQQEVSAPSRRRNGDAESIGALRRSRPTAARATGSRTLCRGYWPRPPGQPRCRRTGFRGGRQPRVRSRAITALARCTSGKSNARCLRAACGAGSRRPSARYPLLLVSGNRRRAARGRSGLLIAALAAVRLFAHGDQ